MAVADNYKYKAFISYSHADEKWAAWLHRSLETYRIPGHVVGRSTAMGPVPERLAPIFRDRDELSTATSLGDTLTRALADSACQIVICSPNAAKSRWTNEEILTYKRLGRSDRVFCLIVDGEPGAANHPDTAHLECFPPALRYELGPDGELSDKPVEPIAADARKGKDSRQSAKLKLIAGMLGVGFDELRQREAQRRHRRMVVLTALALTGMAITSGLAVTAWLARNEAESQRARAETEAETARQTAQFMIDLFKVSDPGEALGNSITAREILDKGAERIEEELAAQPEIQATLMDTMGTVYTSLGLYPEALRLVDGALEQRRTLHGSMHPDVAASLTHLGEVQTLAADYGEAETNLRTALSVRRDTLGASHVLVADTALRLGEVLRRQGRFDEAHGMFAESLDIRRNAYKAPHPAIAEALEHLGLNGHEQGSYDSAVKFLEDALSMRRGIYGDLHPQLSDSINNLAWALLDLGEPERSESLFRESLAMKRKLLGDRHPEIGYALNNLARVIEMRGELDAAESSYREALDIYFRNFGEDHPEIAATTGNLAFVIYAKGRKDEAVELLRNSYEMQGRLLGRDHPATAASAASLGFWLVESGDYEEAERLLDHSLSVRRAVLGEDHPLTAGTLTVFANLMLATRRPERALSAAREAHVILQQSLPEGHWRIAAASLFEGQALAELGEYEQAERVLLASLDGLEQAPIPDLAANGRRTLADVYQSWGRPEQAKQYQ